MDESLEGLAWILATLTGNAALMTLLPGGVWPFQLPQGAALPACVVNPMAGHDVMGMNGTRLNFEGTFQVRMWGAAGDADSLKTAVNDADTLLHKHTGSTSLAVILSCIRENPLPPQFEWEGTSERLGLGGLYRLQVYAL